MSTQGRGTIKLVSLVLTLVTGMLLSAAIAMGGVSAETTTTETTPTTTVETTTAETTTAETTSVETTPASAATTTVRVTTTRLVPVQPGTATTTSNSSSDDTPAWIWVLLGILALGLIALVVILARRGGGGGGGSLSAEARRGQLEAAVASWTAQGWAIESQTADSAALRRGDVSMLVSVDPAGHVGTRTLPET